MPPGDLLLNGRQLRGHDGRAHQPDGVHPEAARPAPARAGSPFDRLVKNYPFAELNQAIADSLSGATIKPVLTFARKGADG